MPLIIFLIIFLFYPKQAIAVTTPALAATASATAAPTNTLSKDIEDIRNKVKEKVQEKLKQITTPTQTTKSSIGKVTETNPSQITINYQNNNQIIKISENTVFIDEKRNKIKADKIKVGQEILCMGDINSDNSINAKRIVLINLKTIENTTQIVVGKIVDISTSSPIFVLIPSKNKDSQFQIKTDTKTEIIDNKNTKIELKSGQKVITIIKPDEKIQKTFYATKIIVQQ